MSSGEQKTVPRGTVIADRYRVDHRLAKGGMATVYVATDTTLSRKVALKVLQAQKGEDTGRLRERFRLEAEALARLNHRHIVAIYDYGDTEEGGHYLVMELVEGPSLFAVMKKERLDVMRAMRIAYQTARALRYAHKAEIVHRDVKTGNILLANEDEEEIAKLVDFGLVKLAGGQQLTAHGLILGTVHCMAPEQIRGGDIDARTDIYALGVVLFRMVTGKYPFQSKQTAEVLAAHLHAAVPTFASIDPDLRVPPDLEDVVRRCMQKNQDNRYQTCSELIRDLEQCMRVPLEDWVLAGAPSAAPQVQVADNNESRSLLMLFILGLFTLVMLLVLIIVVLLARTSELQSASPPSPEPIEAHAAVPAPTAPVPAIEAPEELGSDEADDEPEEAPNEAGADEAEAEAGADEAEAEVPAPAPRSRPRAAPEPAPTAAPEAPPAPTHATMVSAIEVDSGSPDEVTVAITLSGQATRPLHFASESADGDHRKQYQVVFRKAGTALSQTTWAVDHPLVDSVVTSVVKDSLVVQVNSTTTPRMRLEGGDTAYRVVVSP